MGSQGCNKLNTCIFQVVQCSFLYLTNAYCSTEIPNMIKIYHSIKQNLNRNRDPQGMICITFCDISKIKYKLKWGFVGTIHQPLINYFRLFSICSLR